MERILTDIICAMREGQTLDDVWLNKLIRRHLRERLSGQSIGKSALRSHYLRRKGSSQDIWQLNPQEERELLLALQLKPRRSASGVATITVLTKPWPCSGTCIFCPDDERMPKSYLSSEPACQRAEQNLFNPYKQVRSRLDQLEATGHPIDKIELIVLGGTWDDYPKDYRIYFVTQLFLALNGEDSLEEEKASLALLEEAQRLNESAQSRCVGLSFETRPDKINDESAHFMRVLGCTKVQIGVQSLNQEVLDANERALSCKHIKEAFSTLRKHGFKIQAHLMLNLYKATPRIDLESYRSLVQDPCYKPDEIKLYPCMLISGTKLQSLFEQGLWEAYSDDLLIDLISNCMKLTPRYVRISRIIRDISSTDILQGSTAANLRQLVDAKLANEGAHILEIRSREIATNTIDTATLSLVCTSYETALGEERFLEWSGPDEKIAAFLRLSLPHAKDAAMIRELHVYGRTSSLHDHFGDSAQHTGLGRALIEEACAQAKDAGFSRLKVISAVGTRAYYRACSFVDDGLYQARHLA